MKIKTVEEVEVEGKKYPVWYRHERAYKRYHPHDKERLIIKGRTVACVEIGEEHIEAFAECSVLDYYNRHLGRTISAGRLLKALNEPEYIKKQTTRNPPKVVVSGIQPIPTRK